MANKYYYLVSSLPFIAFDRTPPVTSEYFFRECAKWLTDKDAGALRQATAKNTAAETGGSEFLKEWKQFDVSLKTELSEARAARKTFHPERIHGRAREILDQSTPLDMETRFEKTRWDFLETREVDYHFDLNWLMVYYLKLQITERRAGFDREPARRRFEASCEVSYESRPFFRGEA